MAKPKPTPKKRQPATKRENRGRKPGMSDAQINQIEQLLQNRSSIKSACILSGVDPDLYHKWITRSLEANPKPIYVKFSKRMKYARELAKVGMIKEISDAGKGKDGDWRATAWLLERIHPDEFGTHERLHITGKVSSEHKHTVETKSILVIMPEAIAHPRIPPQPKQINAREEPQPPPTAP